MSDVTVSAEAVEEVRPVELPAERLDDQLIGQLVDRARVSGLQLTGDGGLLQQLTKRVLESALQAFDIAFDGRLSSVAASSHHLSYTVDWGLSRSRW
ncbi:hypothetical protein ACFQZP_39225 [Streptomyces lutosisoli]|uniref:Transposase n=1 Tax=Streptomyces lutosisoli TaxID=2665721 RepID=A0ABW2VUE9_9ACTN